MLDEVERKQIEALLRELPQEKRIGYIAAMAGRLEALGRLDQFTRHRVLKLLQLILPKRRAA